MQPFASVIAKNHAGQTVLAGVIQHLEAMTPTPYAAVSTRTARTESSKLLLDLTADPQAAVDLVLAEYSTHGLDRP